MSGLSPDLKQRLRSEMARQSAPTRSQGVARRAAWLALALALVTAVGLMRGFPEASMSRPASYLLVFITIAVVVSALATQWVLMANASSLGRPRSSLQRLAIAVPVALAVGALLANSVAPETWATPAHEWLAHRMCLLLYTGLGGVLLLVFLFGLRPLDPVAPGTTGAALGAVVGAWATTAVSLQCPSAEPFHVVATHVAPAFVLILLGAALGRRVLTFRYSPRR